MGLDGTSYGKSTGIWVRFRFIDISTQKIRFGLGVYDLGGTNVTTNKTS